MILVFGTVCIDRIRRVPFLPNPGGYVEVTEELNHLGGEAANTANALTTWGAQTLLCRNTLEQDSEIVALLDARKIPHLEMPSGKTPPVPVCDIYVTPDGDRTMFGIGFSAMDEGVDIGKVPYRANEWFTAEPNMTKAVEAARLAKAKGMRLYLMDFLGEDLPLGEGDFWQCSTDWAGKRDNEKANVEWVERWVARHHCFAILTDGPRGFVAGSPDHPVRAYPGYPAPKVVDTTGAGDVFRAGMLYGLDRNWSIPESLQFAAAAGCLKCQFLGATNQIPATKEIEEHVQIHSALSRQFF